MPQTGLMVWFAHADRTISRVSRILAALACVLLVLIMIVTVVDTAGRYLFSAPISGSNEIIEIMLSLLIMLAIPMCTLDNAHIRVDLLDNVLGRVGGFLALLFTNTWGAVVLFILGRRAWDKALDAQEYGEMTLYVEFPNSILYGAISASAFIFAAILLWRILVPGKDPAV